MSLRRMIFPYSWVDKMALFPYRYFWDNYWPFKYTILGFFISSPVFYKIQKLTTSPTNVARFEKLRQKQLEEREEHKKHRK